MTAKNSSTTRPDLGAVVSDVLADLAFMVCDDEPADLPVGSVWLQSEVQYTGPENGGLVCWCTRDFAIQLCANLLGIDPDQGNAQIGAEDAVREFMNVLCGQLVTSWFGHQAVFNLSIPTVRECIETPSLADVDPVNGCKISIDGEPFYCKSVSPA